MRIKNITDKASLVNVYGILIPIILFLVFTIVLFTYSGSDNFFLWIIKEASKPHGGSHKFHFYMAVLTLPIWFPICIILAFRHILERKAELKKFHSNNELKYIEFLPRQINFCYYSKNKNYSVPYSHIKELNMTIITNKSLFINYIEIMLQFTMNDDKVIEIHNVPFFYSHNLVYSIIDYSRKIQNFSYGFEGGEPLYGLQERIENFKAQGAKPLLSANQEIIFKWASILLFIIGIFFLLLINSVSHYGEGYVVGAIFIIPSFIADAILFLDKLKEKQYISLFQERIRSDEALRNVPYQAIFTAKITIMILVYAAIVSFK